MNTPVETLAEAVFTSSLRVLASSGKRVADEGQALAAVKDEVLEFLQGDRYQDERDCIRLGTVNSQYVLASVVSSCVLKIKTL